MLDNAGEQIAESPRKYPPASVSAGRIRASLDWQQIIAGVETRLAKLPDGGADLAAPASPPILQPVHSSAADLPSPQPIRFIEPKPLVPIVVPTESPIAATTFNENLNSKRSLLTRAWWILGLTASLTILAVAVPLPMRLSGRYSTQTVVAASPSHVAAPPQFSPASTVSPSAVAATPAAPAVSAAPSAAQHLSIRVNKTAWMSACVDRREVFQTLFSPGDSPAIEFADKAIVRLGNAGGVDLSLNGGGVGPFGSAGELRVLEFTHSGYRLLTLTPGDSRADCELD